MCAFASIYSSGPGRKIFLSMGAKLTIRYVWEVMLFPVTLQQMNEQLMET